MTLNCLWYSKLVWRVNPNWILQIHARPSLELERRLMLSAQALHKGMLPTLVISTAVKRTKHDAVGLFLEFSHCCSLMTCNSLLSLMKRWERWVQERPWGYPQAHGCWGSSCQLKAACWQQPGGAAWGTPSLVWADQGTSWLSFATVISELTAVGSSHNYRRCTEISNQFSSRPFSACCMIETRSSLDCGALRKETMDSRDPLQWQG